MDQVFAGFKWVALFKDWRIFAEGFLTTIELSILALMLALVLGIFFGVLGSSHLKVFVVINRGYVEFFQNTPLVIQVFFIYHGLPHLGINLPVFLVGILGVGIYHGAYVAEVVRAAIQSVHRGQMEAAYSQGFNYWQAMRYIILPQVKKIALPPMTNQAVNLIKNTSVLAMVAGGELIYQADCWSSQNIFYGPAYVVTGLLYLSLCLPLATWARRMEYRLGGNM